MANSGDLLAEGLVNFTLTVEDAPVDLHDALMDLLIGAGCDLREVAISSRTRIKVSDSLGGVERF